MWMWNGHEIVLAGKYLITQATKAYFIEIITFNIETYFHACISKVRKLLQMWNFINMRILNTNAWYLMCEPVFLYMFKSSLLCIETYYILNKHIDTAFYNKIELSDHWNDYVSKLARSLFTNHIPATYPYHHRTPSVSITLWGLFAKHHQ